MPYSNMKRNRFFCFTDLSFFKTIAFAAVTKTVKTIYGRGFQKLLKRNNQDIFFTIFSVRTIIERLSILTFFQKTNQNIFHRKTTVI